MDKYLEKIKSLKGEIDEIEQTIILNRNSIQNLKEEKEKKETILTELSAKQKENENLKTKINNFPKFRRELKRVNIIIGTSRLFLSLTCGVICALNNLFVLACLALVANIVTDIKLANNFNKCIEEIQKSFNNITLEKLDDENKNIIEKERKTTIEISKINALISNLNSSILECISRKNSLNEDIKIIEFMREKFLIQYEIELNRQYDIDKKNNGFQKKLSFNDII